MPFTLKKPPNLILTAKTLSLVQQQLLNFIIASTQDTNQEHCIQLAILLRYLSTTRDTKRIRELLVNMGNATTQIISDSKKATPQEKFSYFESLKIINGVVFYRFSPHIQKLITSSTEHAAINIFLVRAFSCKYSLFLYELCLALTKKGQTPWLDLEYIRNYMNLAPNNYPTFKQLNHHILNRAIKEIHKKTNIELRPLYKKQNNTIVAIKLFIHKTSFMPHLVAYSKQNKIIIDKINKQHEKRNRHLNCNEPLPLPIAHEKNRLTKKEIAELLQALGIPVKKASALYPIYSLTTNDFDKILSIFKTSTKNALFIRSWLKKTRKALDLNTTLP